MDVMEDLFRSGVNTPLGSFIQQVLLTEATVLGVQNLPGGRYPFIEEFFYTFQASVLGHELGVIKKVYGPGPYAVGFFLLTVLYAMTYYPNIYANSASTIHKFAHEKRMTVLELAVHLSVQISACLVAHQYVNWVWSSEIFHSLVLHWDPLSPCKTDIKVPLPLAITVEATLTFAAKLFGHGKSQLPLGLLLHCAVILGLSLIGGPYTGGYFNPSLAFSLQYRCNGHTDAEFFAVYFLGPTIGAFFLENMPIEYGKK
ncbi:aquaporin-11-like [Paramacrobiotus metropolitanus]|uniref:aquaporin-11-like n=1 Tax=Paramacrobiotus metropolitanus TaxID=2943436 RepID=UPI0024460224|nr:aquaporin-11-like [Paramacrobiotus metropolitanus]